RMGESGFDIPEKELSKGDKVLEIHIPGTEPLTPESVNDSIKRAKEFFNKYYPGYEYKCFTCHSWLLDSTLEKILGTTSNILNFRKKFDIVREDSDDGIFRQLFKWNTTREKLRNEVPPNSFACKVKEYALRGEEFHITLGILKD
ncbi:MAG: hypothetical protein IKV88_04000, partial [Clostridia bacterium]|nr:hypothetical protein [Clostridia bacterium]